MLCRTARSLFRRQWSWRTWKTRTLPRRALISYLSSLLFSLTSHLFSSLFLPSRCFFLCVLYLLLLKLPRLLQLFLIFVCFYFHALFRFIKELASGLTDNERDRTVAAQRLTPVLDNPEVRRTRINKNRPFGHGCVHCKICSEI